MGQTQGVENSQSQEGGEVRYHKMKINLGRGSFGTVWKAQDRQTQEFVAIKELDFKKLQVKGLTHSDVRREILMMQECKHENITKLYTFYEEKGFICLVLELCEGGDFGDKVKSRGMKAEEAEVAEWMRQICSAVAYMHSISILHRDIKPDNFLVQDRPGTQGILKLSDFGLAIFYKDRRLQQQCGTPAFQSPEQLQLPKNSAGYGFPADMWAVGLCMYMMMFGGKHPFLKEEGGTLLLDEKKQLTGELDFRDTTQQVGVLSLVGFSGPPLRFSADARKFCKSLVEPEESRRITAQVAVQSEWLSIGTRQKPEADSGAPTIARTRTEPLDVDKTIRRPSPAQDQRQGTPPPKERNGVKAAADLDRVAAQLEEQNRANKALERKLEEERKSSAEKMRAVERKAQELEEQIERTRTKELEERAERERKEKEELEQQQQQRGAPRYDRHGAAPGGAPRFERTRTRLPGADPDNEMATKSVPTRPTAVPLDRARSAQWAEQGRLARGTKCRYESEKFGMLDAIVQDFNEDDKTYNLDCRPHASADKIAPAKVEKALDAWAKGTRVSYLSRSSGWLPAEVMAFNETDKTYDLDIREHAELDRMRLLVEKDRGREGIRTSTSEGVPRMNGRAHDAQAKEFSTTADWGARKTRLITSRPPNGDEDVPNADLAGTRSVGRGDWCIIPNHGLVEIESAFGGPGTYSVKLNGRQKTNVNLEDMRAPKEESKAWGAGTKVSYLSTSTNNRWIEAHVRRFNPESGLYDLDVRPDAAPDKVRPR